MEGLGCFGFDTADIIEKAGRKKSNENAIGKGTPLRASLTARISDGARIPPLTQICYSSPIEA